MIDAYIKFHKAGYAHSIEAWKDGKLAGGFYGILLGSVVCENKPSITSLSLISNLADGNALQIM